MIDIKGYKQISYFDFQKVLHIAFADSKKETIQIAADIKVKSPATAQNAFNTDKQVVSDEVMTNVMKSVGLAGFIIWIFGNKYYYIKTK
jgi:hypothetical protein